MRKLYKVTLRAEGRTDVAEGFFSESSIASLKKGFRSAVEIDEYFYNTLACEIGDYFLGKDIPDDSEKCNDRLYELAEQFMSDPRQWVKSWLDKEHWECPLGCTIGPDTDECDNDYVSELLKEVYRVFWNQYEGYDRLGDFINAQESDGARYDGNHEGDGFEYEERLYYDSGDNTYRIGWDIKLPDVAEGDDGQLHPEPYYSLKNYLDTSDYAKDYIREVDEDDFEEIVAEYKAEKDWRKLLGYTFTNAETFGKDYLNWAKQGLSLEMLPEWCREEILAA